MTPLEQLLLAGHRSDAAITIQGARVSSHETSHNNPPLEIDGLRWEDRKSIAVSPLANVRFHRCQFGPSILVNGSFINCQFSECTFEDARLEGVEFVNCSFEKCDFNDSLLVWLGFWKVRTKLKNCHFSNSDLRRIRTLSSEFSGCIFENCNLKGTDFRGAVLTSCKFIGVLEDTEFHGTAILDRFFPRNTLHDIDFTAATLRQVNFFHINVEPGWLPNDDNLLILPRGKADLLEWKAAMFGDARHPDFYIDESIRSMGSPSLMEKDTLTEIYGEAKVQILEAIARRSNHG